MAESADVTPKQAPNRLLSLLPKFPFGANGGEGGGAGRVDIVIKKESPAGEGEGEDSRTSDQPDVVKFRFRQPQTEPLKLENEAPEHNTNPFFLWQVYALGGFIFVKWAWAKWQQRQADAKKGDSNEEEKEEDQSPADDE